MKSVWRTIWIDERVMQTIVNAGLEVNLEKAQFLLYSDGLKTERRLPESVV